VCVGVCGYVCECLCLWMFVDLCVCGCLCGWVFVCVGVCVSGSDCW
jgi:hypothetical protein